MHCYRRCGGLRTHSLEPEVRPVLLPVRSRFADNERVLNRRHFVAGLCAAVTAATCRGLAGQTRAAGASAEARVDLNHASIDELLKVPGMTRSWAGRIVRFRPYRAKTDLVDHGVVTAQFYEIIKNYVIAHRDPQ